MIQPVKEFTASFPLFCIHHAYSSVFLSCIKMSESLQILL